MSNNVFMLKNIEISFDDKKSRGEFSGLKIDSLEIPRGSTTAILGDSGCGKTTLLNLLALMENGSSTRIRSEIICRLNSRPHVEYSHMEKQEQVRFRRENFGFIFQNDHLINNYSASLNAMMPRILGGHGGIKRSVFKELMKQFELSEKIDANPGDLSGGERSRIGILRALLHEPEVVFADEPTPDLDKDIENEVIAAIKGWKDAREERTFIFATHNLNLALEWADYIIIFFRNRKKNSFTIQSYDVKEGIKPSAVDNIAEQLSYPESAQSAVLSLFDPKDKEIKDEIINDNIELMDKYQGIFNQMRKNNKASFFERLKNYSLLTFFDFIRHPRKKGSKLVMWGAPGLVFGTILLLFFILFLVSGSRKGTIEQFQKELSNPFLWQTYVSGNAVERIGSDLYKEKSGFQRLYFSFRKPGKENREIDLPGRTMDCTDQLAPIFREQIVPANGIDPGILLADNSAFGIIMTKNGLEKLGYKIDSLAKGPLPEKIEFVFHVQGSKNRGGSSDSIAYIPIPVLGVSENLPYGDFIMSEGFMQIYHKGELNMKLLTDYAYVQFKPVLQEEEILDFRTKSREVFAELKKKLELKEGLELDEVEQEDVDGHEKIYLGLAGAPANDNNVYFFVFKQIVNKTVAALGWKKKYLFDFGEKRFQMEFDASTARYRHWNFTMIQNINRVNDFISKCQKEDLFVDTSIVEKVKSLRKSSKMFNAMFNATWWGALIFSIGIMVIIFWFDSFRRIHNIGVLFALGASIWFYLIMAVTQLSIVCIICMLLTFGFIEPVVNPIICGWINHWIDPQQSMIVYHGLSSGEQVIMFFIIFSSTIALVTLMKYFIFNKYPSELIGYQD